MDDQPPSAAARLTWLPAVSLLMAAVVGAVVGVVHGLFSLYWAFGGDWLISTLGDRIVDVFAGRRWLLFPVTVIKVGFAMLPLVLLARGWPLRRLSRLVCWLGTVGFVLWGGINTVTGNLVLSGLLRPAAGYDRPGMVGHAWLWDPLFLIWGITVTIGLLSTRGNTNTQLVDHG